MMGIISTFTQAGFHAILKNKDFCHGSTMVVAHRTNEQKKTC